MADDHEETVEEIAPVESTESETETQTETDTKDSEEHTGKPSCCEHCSATRERVDDHHNRIEGVEKNVGDIGSVLDRLTTHLESQGSGDSAPAKAKPAPKVSDSKPAGGHFLTKKWGGKNR